MMYSMKPMISLQGGPPPGWPSRLHRGPRSPGLWVPLLRTLQDLEFPGLPIRPLGAQSCWVCVWRGDEGGPQWDRGQL